MKGYDQLSFIQGITSNLFSQANTSVRAFHSHLLILFILPHLDHSLTRISGRHPRRAGDGDISVKYQYQAGHGVGPELVPGRSEFRR